MGRTVFNRVSGRCGTRPELAWVDQAETAIMVVALFLLVLAMPVSAQDESDQPRDELDFLFSTDRQEAAPSTREPTANSAQQAVGESEETLPTIPVNTEAEENLSEDSRPKVIDEIIVTAQRREQALIDVPIAVTAMDTDALESRGIGRVDDLNSLAPGLQISRSPANTTISQIAIRGSSQINPAIYWDPAVGLYLDGVYIGKAQGSIFDVVDLAAIEVLRGPQGTLYGRNTIAGTINLVSRKPSGEFAGRTAVEFGSFNQRVQKAALDLPKIGPLSLNFGVRSERRDGWVDTTETSSVDELNNRYSDGFQMAARLEFGDSFEIMARMDKSDVDQTNVFLQLVRSDMVGTEQHQSTERRTTADIDALTLELAETEGYSLTVSWSPWDWLNFKSITGTRDVHWHDALDLDGTPDATARSQRITDYEQFSQDFNLSGEIDSVLGGWNYTGGYYIFEDDGFTNNPLNFLNDALNFDSRYGTKTEAWAVYGQMDWQPSWEPISPLTATFGLRHTSETKQLTRVVGVSTNPLLPFVYFISEGFETPETEFSDTTPTASLAWKFTDNFNSYVRYAEGFKSGGFNGEYSNTQDVPDDGNPNTLNDNQTQTLIPFRPEKQQSWEIGLKSWFWDRRISANLALFQNKLEDLQASIFTGGGAAATVVRNAGEATVRGLELETSFAPISALNILANIALLDPEYDVFEDEDADGNFGNQAHNRAFVHAPELSWNVVLDARIPTFGVGELRAVVDYVWTDAFFTYPYQLTNEGEPGHDPDRQVAANSEVEAHGLLNAKLSWGGFFVGEDSTLEISLWGRNILDEDTATNFIDFGPGAFQNLTTANFVEPRSVGASLSMQW